MIHNKNKNRDTVKAKVQSLIEQGATVDEIIEEVSKSHDEQEHEERLHDKSIPITERIKTFEDALEYLGEDSQTVKSYRAIDHDDDTPVDINAYAKLRVIAAALNEEPGGWRPEYRDENRKGGEYRWAPYFQVVAFNGGAKHGALDGISFAYCDAGVSAAGAGCGSRICYKKKEIAIYSGKQFKDIWEEFVML